jgi:hypothetical protein
MRKFITVILIIFIFSPVSAPATECQVKGIAVQAETPTGQTAIVATRKIQATSEECKCKAIIDRFQTIDTGIEKKYNFIDLLKATPEERACLETKFPNLFAATENPKIVSGALKVYCADKPTDSLCIN